MQTQLLIPTLPVGYTTRPATLNDAAAALHLSNTVSLAEVNAAEHEFDELVRWWQSPNFDITADTLLIHDADDLLVAYGAVWMMKRPPLRPRVELFIWPDHPHTRDLGAYLLTWGEAQAQRAIAFCPPEAQVSFTSGTHITNPLGLETLQAHGMVFNRIYYMMEGRLDATPPTPIWPVGVTVRAMRDKSEGRAFYAAKEDMFSKHYGHIPDPELKDYERWAHLHFDIPEFDPSLWFAAEVDGEIVGLLWCLRSMPEDDNLGWVDILGVRDDWRQHGLGLALLHHGFGELYRRGATRVGLNVDAGNSTGATRLYERAGMWAERIWHSYEKELRPGVVLYAQ